MNLALRRVGVKGFRNALSACFWPWLLSRFMNVVSLALAKEIFVKTQPSFWRTKQVVSSGLFAWDSGHYQLIATSGYGLTQSASLRFFPLFPMMGHLISEITLISPGYLLIGLSSLFALAASLCIYGLCIESGYSSIAKLSPWIFFIQPASFIFTMAYSDSLYIFIEGLIFLLLSKENPKLWLIFTVGIAGGLARPTGLLLCIPVIWVGLFGRNRMEWKVTLPRVFRYFLAAMGPLVGQASI